MLRGGRRNMRLCILVFEGHSVRRNYTVCYMAAGFCSLVEKLFEQLISVQRALSPKECSSDYFIFFFQTHLRLQTNNRKVEQGRSVTHRNLGPISLFLNLTHVRT